MIEVVERRRRRRIQDKLKVLMDALEPGASVADRRDLAKTRAYEMSRHVHKKVSSHISTSTACDRPQFEITLAAIAQYLRCLARRVGGVGCGLPPNMGERQSAEAPRVRKRTDASREPFPLRLLERNRPKAPARPN